jgi:hypothetical protein
MSEFSQDSRLEATEDIQPTTSPVQSDISVPVPTKPDQQTSELYADIKRIIARSTFLAEDASALVAFWAVSTWFREALQVFPILLVSGPAFEANSVLNVLNELCREPVLLACFTRGDLKDLRGFTFLISAPHLDKRTVALLGNLTDRKFCFADQGSLLPFAASRALHIGEDAAIGKIPHSLHVHASPAHGENAVAHWSLRAEFDDLRKRILAYQIKHLGKVRSLEFNPRGL